MCIKNSNGNIQNNKRNNGQRRARWTLDTGHICLLIDIMLYWICVSLYIRYKYRKHFNNRDILDTPNTVIHLYMVNGKRNDAEYIVLV